MNRTDVERAANFLIEKYGHRAFAEAADNLESVLAQEEAQDAVFWHLVMAELREAETNGLDRPLDPKLSHHTSLLPR